MKNSEVMKQEILERVLMILDYSKEMRDEEVKEIIRECISDKLELRTRPVRERKLLEEEVFSSLRGWDILQVLLDDEAVTEIMVNGQDHIFVEKGGFIEEFSKQFSSEEKIRDVIQRIAAGCNRSVNDASPILDARLDNGDRVNVVLSPVALNGPIITIRRFPKSPVTINDLIAYGSLSEDVAFYLKCLVEAGYNILVSGGTGSGKTTFLNVLSQFVPKDERIITIEDSAELQIINVPNLVRLESRNANMEGCRAISIRDLIKTALRMRPDRIIVGEVRGGEAADMMQCLNTGHDGSMSTGHANSARDMLSRLETMILMGMEIPLEAIRKQIASGLDIIIHLGRMRDKSRKVLEICEVAGYGNGEIIVNPLFEFEDAGEDENGKVQGKLVKRGELICDGKLKAAGLHLSYGNALDFCKSSL